MDKYDILAMKDELFLLSESLIQDECQCIKEALKYIKLLERKLNIKEKNKL